MRALILVSILWGSLWAGAAGAKDCRWEDGGYCVAEIAEQTTKKLGWGKVVSSDGGIVYLNYYESLWDWLVHEKKGAVHEREKVFGEAERVGGTKIGGVNLVVLAAGTLQHLVDKKVITREEAQRILDEAKK